MSLSIRLLLILIGVVLFRFAFPGGNIPLLAFIAMVPLIMVCHHSKPITALLLGLIFGTATWAFCTWWTMIAVESMASSSRWIVLPFFLIFCMFYALPYAVYGYLISKYKLADSLHGTLAGTLALTLMIFIVPHVLPGNIVHSLYEQPQLIQVVDIGGLPLLFFIVNLINTLFAYVILMFKQSKPMANIALGLIVMILGTVLSYGHVKIDHIQNQPGNKTITVGIVQPNIPVSWRDDDVDHYQDVYQRLADLSIRLKETTPDVDVILWPEIPTPFSYNEDEDDRAFIQTLQQDLQVDILFSSGYEYADDNEEYYYNTAQILSNGELTSYYKQILMPFGEYLPFKDKLSWLDTLFPEALNYVPGNQYQHLITKDNIKILPLVCYEAVFSRFVAKGIEPDTDLMVNLVDDAWFAQSAAAEIHFALSTFRAIEHRIPLVRVTNTGISAIINADGSISQMDKTLDVERGFTETLSL